ncbi:MAG: hypothetical protein RIQ99_331 [Pseudomonadota bacterium]|jgi:DNA-binding MarR family transcriptional regulator
MDNPFLDYPGYLLRRAANSRLAHLGKRLEPLGVKVTEASILTLIGRNPDISQAECGRLLSIQRANLNPIIRNLRDRKLVVCTQGQGRTLCLRLTDQGQALGVQILQEFEAQEARIFEAVPEHLRPELVPLLRGLYCSE